MNSIQILDCTLRDGGYINNWEFSPYQVEKIAQSLTDANSDYIELGFLTNKKSQNSNTLFENITDVNFFLNNRIQKEKICLMIKIGNYDISKIPNYNLNLIKNIRIIFKKNETNEALFYIKELKQKGYNVFANPTYLSEYSLEELKNLIAKINSSSPNCFSIVDTLGTLKEKELIKIYNLIENKLNKNIKVCFHSHNSLQLSLINAITLIKIAKRDIIIDSSIFGMGRGSGNIQTEILMKYLNDNYKKNYDITPILKILQEEIKPIYKKSSWGYALQYYLTACNHCHPYYAKYMIDNNINSINKIEEILKAIPPKNKLEYNEDIIKNIILQKSNILNQNNLLTI